MTSEQMDNIEATLTRLESLLIQTIESFDRIETSARRIERLLEKIAVGMGVSPHG